MLKKRPSSPSPQSSGQHGNGKQFCLKIKHFRRDVRLAGEQDVVMSG
jgi:hypothetical protein